MRDDQGRVKLQLRGSVTELDSQSGGLGSTPAPLPTNFFVAVGLAWLKFSAITLNRQLVVYSHLLLLLLFVYPVTLYLSYLFLTTIYIRNSCNYRSGIYSNKRHGTY